MDDNSLMDEIQYETVVREIQDICIIQDANINKENINKLFLKNNVDIIYVAKESSIIGVISLGLYSRNYNKSRNKWINYNFAKATNRSEAEKILYGYLNINIEAVPVINENNEIQFVLEKRIKETSFNRLLLRNNDIIKNIIQQTCEGRNIVYCSKKKQYQVLIEEALSEYAVTEEKDDARLQNSENHIVIFDTEKEKKKMRIYQPNLEKKSYSIEFFLKRFLIGYRISNELISLGRKGVHIAIARDLQINQIKNATEEEKKRVLSGKPTSEYLSGDSNLSLVEDVIGKELFNDEFIHNWLEIGLKREKGLKSYYNFKSQYINYNGYFRNLPDKIEKDYKNTLFIAGICWTAAGFTDDKHTCGNYLQKYLNKDEFDYGVQVGYYKNESELLWWLKECKNLKENDIFLLSLDYINEFIIDLINPFIKIIEIEMSSAFNRPHNYGELFIDHPDHMGAQGQELCAKKIYIAIKKFLEENNSDTDNRR